MGRSATELGAVGRAGCQGWTTREGGAVWPRSDDGNFSGGRCGINFRTEVGSAVGRVEVSRGGGGDVRIALGLAGERMWIREVIVKSGSRAGKGTEVIEGRR